MTQERPLVNILHRYDTALFTPHFDPVQDGFDVVENGDAGRDWDLLVVFEAMAGRAACQMRSARTVFVAGEPPEIGRHARSFLSQFDAVFCAGAPLHAARLTSHEQHFNNWHFGFSAVAGAYRYDHRAIRDMPPAPKSLSLSTVTSNLNYLPMHIRRRALLDRLAQDYGDRIDLFGRPHRFIEHKEDAILPYRFHICVENCAVPGLWTEKIADALLGYAVPVYAGCPDIERYFPGATIAIDLDDYAGTRRTVDAILTDGDALYASHFDAVVAARRRLIDEYDMAALVRGQLRSAAVQSPRLVELRPEVDFPTARARAVLARVRRKAAALAWRRKVARRG